MNKDRELVYTAAIVSVIYMLPGFFLDPLISVVTFLAFIAGAAVARREDEPFWLIVTGEILIINNFSIISSLLIQTILAAVFFRYYISGDIRETGIFTAVFLAISGIFAYLSTGMNIAVYTLVCIMAIAAGYAVTGFIWRRISLRKREEI